MSTATFSQHSGTHIHSHRDPGKVTWKWAGGLSAHHGLTMNQWEVREKDKSDQFPRISPSVVLPQKSRVYQAHFLPEGPAVLPCGSGRSGSQSRAHLLERSVPFPSSPPSPLWPCTTQTEYQHLGPCLASAFWRTQHSPCPRVGYDLQFMGSSGTFSEVFLGSGSVV